MLTLYEPKYEDLWFRQMMLADEDTMSYNHAWGGTIPFGEDKWRGWYDCWIADPDGKRYYRYLKNEDGQFVGEIAYHYDAEMQQEIANVMIYAKYSKIVYHKIGGFASGFARQRKIFGCMGKKRTAPFCRTVRRNYFRRVMTMWRLGSSPSE